MKNPKEHLLQFFQYEHLPQRLQPIAIHFKNLAHYVAVELPMNPETTTALRKLLGAKDCAVRSALLEDNNA